ncbi:MAG TPA: hypothetical protein PLK63_00040 [Catalimonadaceae bacterium]|nr:hypothetical protein [Catalimonadaceae bacterium]
MNRFIALTRLFQQEKEGLIRQNALSDYFKQLHSEDILWAIALLSGKKLLRKIPSGKLLEIANELPDLPEWLIGECVSITGDATETLSLLIIPTDPAQINMKECITALIGAFEAKGKEQLDLLHDLWAKLPDSGIAIVNQIVTSRFPYTFTSSELSKAIAKAFDLDPCFTTFQLSQSWSPVSDSFEDLFYRNYSKELLVRPYPFNSPTILSENAPFDFSHGWTAGLWWSEPQLQMIKRGELVLIWSESGELMNDSFPSLVKTCRKFGNDFVVTGQMIQKGLLQELTMDSSDKLRKERTVSPGPVFIANDLLEFNGENIFQNPFEIRQRKLADLMKSDSDTHPELTMNEMVIINNSDDLDHRLQLARELKSTGVYIREIKSGGYGESTGFLVPVRKFLFSGVLIYMQETNVHSVEKQLELSIAAAHDGSVLPVTKVMLSVKDQPDLFQLIRKFVAGNTIEKFGPVRKVLPQLVFEISFETIHVSKRHKSGVAIHNPRIVRMEPDKLASDIHRLEDLKQLL